MKFLKLALLILVLPLAGLASEAPELGVRSRLIDLAGKTAQSC
jgi:hypothetical protein